MMHKALLLTGLVLGGVSALVEWGQAQDAKKSVAATPVPRTGANTPDHIYLKDHEARVNSAGKRAMDVIFIGDSITQAWSAQGKDIWKERFAPLNAVNYGSSGDRTQHVLWRILNGEFNSKPKAAVVMIGTNNQFYDSAEDITEGVTDVVKAIRKVSPDTKVMLMSVLPRGNKLPKPSNDKMIEVNKRIAKLDDGKMVRFVDIYAKYLENGQISKELMHDDTHLTAKGYEIWADALTPLLKEIVGMR